MFVGSDVISEHKSEDGATHNIERRCKLDVDAPRLLKRVLHGTLTGHGLLSRSHNSLLSIC